MVNCTARSDSIFRMSLVASVLLGMVFTVANAGFVVPITLQNSQGVPTAAPFQQMISVPTSAYSQYEAGDLGNIRFSQGGQEPLVRIGMHQYKH